MKMELTAAFRKVPQGYIGFIEELPGVNTQGPTLEEARALREAVIMVLEANRALAEETLQGGNGDLWAHADPEMRALAEEARQGAIRLEGPLRG